MQDKLPPPIKLVVKRAGSVCIHTFISPFTGNNIANATHIIESENKLVVVDGQFLVTYAEQFIAYAKNIKDCHGNSKPIERVYLSHRHPDHWFGLAFAFRDTEIYALKRTVDAIKEHGEDSIKDHPGAPENVVIPQNIASPGNETIDGVKYIFEEEINAEVEAQLTIKLPDLKVYIVQDLIYSGTHLYLPTKVDDFDHWIEILQNMLEGDYELFLPGHGFPADKIEVARNIEYLCAARDEIINNRITKYDFKQFMLDRYRGTRLCPKIFDTYLPRLFDGASQF